MSGRNLKKLLLKAHRRDLLLTGIHYTIIGVAVMVFTGAILWIIFNPLLSERQTVQFIIALGIVALIIPLYHVFKLSSRRKEIYRLLQCIDIGAKAHTLKEYKTYKTLISMGETSINWLPVRYLSVLMDNDNRPFNLPIYQKNIPEVKELLMQSAE